MMASSPVPEELQSLPQCKGIDDNYDDDDDYDYDDDDYYDEWLTDEMREALFSAGTIARYSHHSKSKTCHDQDLNLVKPWFMLC